MYNLVLNVGDFVRNIKKVSSRYLCRGVVTFVGENLYYVEYRSGVKQYYHKKTAHKYLEKIVEINNQCKCIHDEVCDKCARQMLKNFLAPLYYGAGPQTLAEYMAEKKTTLKKERRNVITGKTQSEMIKQCGTALGVTQFNTRALGKSTGQAMVKIGEAMMHPNVPVRIMDVDHAITEQGTQRRVINKHFADTIEGIIRKQGLKGLHILNGEELLYLPIVTEETYVNI
ncbi:hypothetical protein C_54 [Escherichia phage vB_EcoP_C]|uniref:Uncharacterized protein n=3 Tax=Vectrevirus sp. 'cee' TaxID=2733585 RepID=A0A1Q1PVD6_9CAUD|nr:hypothetical protein HOR58_gp54 [Escherichia phage vB_EcoP_C]AQN31693.1 hypothetical protein C_54 [Escherichia phage vB_EcoP_C]AQN31723.1 hypothetical protein D_25 [Escherichia phage vB_EcoP_D]AQN32026.1 hypothetical protein R_26 [Escherichia phage vB_EcoP_R]